MTYHLVLDATAVAAYAAESIHVGEVLAEVGDEYRPSDPGDGGTGPLVCVPVPAAIVAALYVADQDRIDILLGLPYVVGTPILAGGWRRAVTATQLLGSLDRACAALAVDSSRAGMILTAEPEVYGGLDTIGI